MHGPTPVARDQDAAARQLSAGALRNDRRLTAKRAYAASAGMNASMPQMAMAEIPTRRRSSASRTAAPEHSSAECSGAAVQK